MECRVCLTGATPEGWRAGKRPRNADSPGPEPIADEANAEKVIVLIREIEEMADAIGKRLYRGVLKTVARVWNPTEIKDSATLRTVLSEMGMAEQELRRLDAVLNQVQWGVLTAILRSLRIQSVDQIDSPETLKRVISDLEGEREIHRSA